MAAQTMDSSVNANDSGRGRETQKRQELHGAAEGEERIKSVGAKER